MTGLGYAPLPHHPTVSGALRFPVYFLIAASIPTRRPEARPRRSQRRTASPCLQHASKIAPERWAEVAERAQSESLRELAVAYDVSHEMIRKIVRAVEERGRIPRAEP